MAFQVFIRAEAQQDVRLASDWYQQQQTDLNIRFIDEFNEIVEKLGDMPLAYPKTFGEFRRILFNKFPYSAYYFVENDSVIIFAVIHGARNPENWQHRLI